MCHIKGYVYDLSYIDLFAVKCEHYQILLYSKICPKRNF